MIINKQSNKLKPSYKEPYRIIQTQTNIMVKLQMGVTTVIIYIRIIKPYNEGGNE